MRFYFRNFSQTGRFPRSSGRRKEQIASTANEYPFAKNACFHPKKSCDFSGTPVLG